MKTLHSIVIARAILPLLLAGGLATRGAAAGFQLSAAAREKIAAEAQRLIDGHRTPGIAIGIMSEGEIIYAEGFGMANLETGTKVTPDSVFAIGSNTKQFTAVAIALLAEQGRLEVDDPLSKFFPDFPRADEVTLRHLLTHSSGIHPVMIPGGLPTPEQRVALRSAADLLPIIQGQTNLYDFAPGTAQRYSNSGYILLGLVIEKVSGLSLGEFFKRHLFDRAGMTASAVDDPREVVPNRASGYSRAPGSDVFINPPLLKEVGTGGAGIRSTVGDMLRWQDALLSGRILSSESLNAMTTPAGEKGRPFGVVIREQNGHAVINSGGGGPGFRSTVKIFPEDRVAFVVMTNSGAPQMVGAPDRSESPVVEAPPPKKNGKGKKKSSPQRAQGELSPARELEQVLTELFLES